MDPGPPTYPSISTSFHVRTRMYLDDLGRDGEERPRGQARRGWFGWVWLGEER